MREKKKVVYVGGPYRAKDHWLIEKNIRAAEELALRVWATKRASAVCPHTMCRYYQGHLEDDLWLNGLLDILSVCDALLLVDGWEKSEGTIEEIRLAQSLGMPIFYSFDDFMLWIINN